MRQGTVSSFKHTSKSANIGMLFQMMAELGLEMYLIPKGSPTRTGKEEWTEKWCNPTYSASAYSLLHKLIVVSFNLKLNRRASLCRAVSNSKVI